MTDPIVPERGVPLTAETVVVPVEPTEAMLRAAKPWPKHWPKYEDASVSARFAFNVDRAVIKSQWRDMLSAAPAREPEGAAVDEMRRDMAAIGHAVRMLTDEIGRIPEKGRDPVTINNLEYYASQIAEWSGRYAAITPKEAPAATGAGENFRAQVVNLLDELIAHIVAIGPDKPNLNTPMSRRVWREVFAGLITALRAQPQAREEAQPYGWVYERLDFGPEWCAGLEWYPAEFTKKPPTPDRSRNVIALYTAPPTHPLAEGADAEKLFKALRDESWDLRCFNVPTGGDDCDIGWRVVGHWQAEPCERTIAEVFSDDPAEAVRQALAALQQEGRA